MIIATIHQPHFLPWLGYFNKLLHADIFIWLHGVQYRKNYFQNRCLVKNLDDQPLWLTVPVHAHHDTPIDQVGLADERWRGRLEKTIQMCYGQTPFYADCWPPLQAALAADGASLDSLNYHCFRALLELLGSPVPEVVRAGDLAVTTTEPTQRLVACCQAVGATHYIAGKGGHNYLDLAAFEQAGIRVIWQQFNPETVRYRQRGGPFLSGLSIIDCRCVEGPERTREIALGAWQPDLT
jgi:hypothetical protein